MATRLVVGSTLATVFEKSLENDDEDEDDMRMLSHSDQDESRRVSGGGGGRRRDKSVFNLNPFRIYLSPVDILICKHQLDGNGG